MASPDLKGVIFFMGALPNFMIKASLYATFSPNAFNIRRHSSVGMIIFEMMDRIAAIIRYLGPIFVNASKVPPRSILENNMIKIMTVIMI